ncbi:hypothetical protein ACFVAF_38485 [Streptomyces sp. NPDC057596]|uniref:hypothetical protein n=1 Tax=Streptomyces sp. NPDC057596 TaxID=3346178 RepID=UPI0036B56DF0
MDASRQIAARIEFLRRQLVDGEPGPLRDAYLAVPTRERPVLQGTTTPALTQIWQQRPSGLITPATAETQPIDLMAVYLTFEEIFGFPADPAYPVKQLEALPLSFVLKFCAELLNALSRPGASHSDVDRAFATQWLKEPIRTRVLNELRDPRRALVVPQALMLLARAAVEHSPDSLPDGAKPGKLIGALLAFSDMIGLSGAGGPTVIADQPGDLGREVIANQYFNNNASVPHTFARYVRRWRELPQQFAGKDGLVDLPAVYEQCTGVTLDDLTVVAGALWTAACNGNVLTPTAELETLLPAGQVTKVLALISADLETLRQAVQDERAQRHTEWTFDAFQQRPVIRLGAFLLVMDQRHLIDRAFGWLPILDVRFPPDTHPRPTNHKKLAGQAIRTLRRFSELYVSEVLHSIAGQGATRRVYDDAELKAAFQGEGQKIADAAVDYGDTWIVVEVTTSQLQRDAATAVPGNAQVKDIDKLLEEVQQIDATIQALRRDESRLTGASSQIRRRYLPLLLLTEGFPVNPVSMTVIRERAHKRGLLQGQDVMPLEVIDVEELEWIEALQEQQGVSLLAVIQRKQASSLERTSMRSFLADTITTPLNHPQRFEGRASKALGPLEAVLLKRKQREP